MASGKWTPPSVIPLPPPSPEFCAFIRIVYEDLKVASCLEMTERIDCAVLHADCGSSGGHERYWLKDNPGFSWPLKLD